VGEWRGREAVLDGVGAHHVGAIGMLTEPPRPAMVRRRVEQRRMTPEEIRELVSRLDTTSQQRQEESWSRLRDLGAAVVPYLAEAFRSFRKWQGRVSLVFHCIRYARDSDHAYRLGLEALSDKSTLVRYRACGLLAYAQKPEAVEHLRPLLRHADQRTADDAKAAIDAIDHRNHHFFVDRTHSGRSFWQVGVDDVHA
jgi:hypothetical protein